MSSTKISLNKEEYIKYCWNAARSYCRGVEDGTIICNENIRLAVKRHEADLQRSDLIWRQDKVEKVFNFFSYLFIDKNTQFILEPFQCFIILALFGLYFKNSEDRKYLYAFLFIGRKNGKTAFAAGMQLYFMLGDGITFPQSVLVAGTQNQANDTAFKELRQMIICSPAMNDRLEVMQSNKIVFKDPKRYGWCKTVPAISDRLEGLNPTSCILDELHTYKDGQKFNVIKNALGTKKNPMLFLISTAGYGKDSFCAQLVETGRNVLRRISHDDRFFYLLYELEEGDDINDESVWIKANPGLGTILDIKLFRDQFNTNKTIPSLLSDFVTKRFNIFLDENSQWIPIDELLKVVNDFNLNDLKEFQCYVGVDLSNTRDLTSIVLFFDAGDKFYVVPYFYFVRRADNSLRKGNVNIIEWVEKKEIIECKTPVVDYDLIKDSLIKINQEFRVVGLYYDPWHFDRLLNDMKANGIWCVPIPPMTKFMDGAIRFFEALVYEKKVDIYKNRCLLWNFRNVVIKSDQNGNFKPNKNDSLDAIDGVVSLLNCVAGYLQQNKNAAAIFARSE